MQACSQAQAYSQAQAGSPVARVLRLPVAPPTQSVERGVPLAPAQASFALLEKRVAQRAVQVLCQMRRDAALLALPELEQPHAAEPQPVPQREPAPPQVPAARDWVASQLPAALAQAVPGPPQRSASLPESASPQPPSPDGRDSLKQIAAGSVTPPAAPETASSWEECAARARPPLPWATAADLRLPVRYNSSDYSRCSR